jgi:hypothetical protein
MTKLVFTYLDRSDFPPFFGALYDRLFRSALMRKLMVSEEDLTLLKSYGLPDEKCDELVWEIGRWMAPALIFYSLAIVGVFTSLFFIPEPNGHPGPFDELAYPLAVAFLYIPFLTAARFFVWLYRKGGPSKPRYLLDKVAVLLDDLHWLSEIMPKREGLLAWHGVHYHRSKIRSRLTVAAWKFTGTISVIVGRQRHKRSWANIADYGKWLCWLSEDLDDRARIEGCLHATVDLILHLLGPYPWTQPRLTRPPRQARLIRPRRLERLMPRAIAVRAGLVALLPLVTALITLLTKLM